VVAFELLTRTQAFQMIVQGKDEVHLTSTDKMCTPTHVHAFVLPLLTPLHAIHPCSLSL
jgi:hypothetical protein